MNSENLYKQSNNFVPGGVHSPVRAFKSVGGSPIFFQSAAGPFLTSVEGVRYIDFCTSFGPLILGHRHPLVQKKVEEMINTAWTFGACEPYSLKLAEFIVQNVSHVEKVRFVSSGTEAVMTALRIARAATNRSKILKFDGCYHGHVDSMLVKSGSGLAGEASSDSAGLTEDTIKNTLVCELDNTVQLEQIFETHGRQIAAVIIEPLPANYGLLIQRKEFLEKIQSLCSNYGSLFILDEVISGFRTSLGGMSSDFNLKPDLVCYGKVMGGGFNVAAYAGLAKYMNLIAPEGPVYQAGTLSANPIAVVAGLTTLEIMKSENGWSLLNQKTKNWVNSLNDFFEQERIPLFMSHHASLFWLHQKTNATIRRLSEIPLEHKNNYNKLFHLLIKKQIYMAPSAFEVGFLSLSHNEDVLLQTSQALQSSCLEIYKL
jgi:glutamate-1-semialdehyde 2,1-aminomutase